MTQDVRLTGIEKGINKIMIRVGIVFACCTVIGAAMAAQSLYDNDVAKKKDTDKLSAQISDLRQVIGDLSVRFDAFNASVKRRNDSLGLIIANIQKQHKTIGKNVAWVIEVKKHGANGPVTMQPVKN